MESSNSLSGGRPRPTQSRPRILTETERLALRERGAQARAVAATAIEHYVVLLAQSQHRMKMKEQTLLAIEATREMLRQSVQRYAQVMKALNTSSERTLWLVRETLAERLPDPAGEEATRDLVESVLAWCIEAYSDSPAA